ncbi:hypothetical protein ACFE04_001589 [Oxalis oulophora]
MEFQLPSLTNWAFCSNPTEGMQELSQSLLYTKLELDATILSAKDEITKREVELSHLKELLTKTIKERDEAKSQCQILMVDKIMLQQKLQFPGSTQFLNSPTSSTEDESKFRKSPALYNVPDQETKGIASPWDNLAGSRPLPEKGRLLQAVKEAGPLLKTLLIGGGPLPQWQHPPPQLDTIEIPPVNINSSPLPSLTSQSSFSSGSSTSLSGKKRACEFSDSVSPKYQRLVNHH